MDLTPRAYVYTLASLIVLAPIFTFLVSYMNAASSAVDRTDKIIADQTANFEANTEADFVKASTIAARRAVLSAVSYAILNGSSPGNASEIILTLMTNGTINNQPQLLMENSTLPEWNERMIARALNTGYFLSLDYSDLAVKPYDSFNLYFGVTLYVNVTSFNNKTTVRRIATPNFTISLEYIEDPLYPMNAFGFVKRIIRKSPYPGTAFWLAAGTNASGNVSGPAVVSSDPAYLNALTNKASLILVTDNISAIASANSFLGAVGNKSDVPAGFSKPYVSGIGTTSAISTNLTIYLDGQTKKVWFLDNLTKGALYNKSYYASENGSSFLDRLDGRYNISDYYRSQSSNIIGLETFVDLPELNANSVATDPTQSVIDPLYWDFPYHPGLLVRGMPFWFRLDPASASRYNISELLG